MRSLFPWIESRWEQLKSFVSRSSSVSRSGPPHRGVSDQESFYRLLRSVQADAGLRASIQRLAALPDELRHASVLTLLRQLEAQGAPQELRRAIQSLQQRDVAEAILSYFRSADIDTAAGERRR